MRVRRHEQLNPRADLDSPTCMRRENQPGGESGPAGSTQLQVPAWQTEGEEVWGEGTPSEQRDHSGITRKGGERVYFCLIKKFYNTYSELSCTLFVGRSKTRVS